MTVISCLQLFNGKILKTETETESILGTESCRFLHFLPLTNNLCASIIQQYSAIILTSNHP